MMPTNYVKFQRGSTAAYNLAKTNNRLNSDTLYFVYDSNASSGLLYLGDILIGGVGSGSQISSLADLSDVLVSNLGASDILVYTSEGKWVNKTTSEIADLIAAEAGLGFTVDSNVFLMNDTSTVQNLELIGFSDATAGMIPIKGNDGKLQWTNDLATLTSKVEDLESSLSNSLEYKIVDGLESINDTGIIYLIPNSDATLESSNKYSEYMLIDGAPELLGDWSVDLSDYAKESELQSIVSDLNDLKDSLDDFVSTTVFSSVVGDITQLYSYTEEAPITIIEELNNINERLVWQQIGAE